MKLSHSHATVPKPEEGQCLGIMDFFRLSDSVYPAAVLYKRFFLHFFSLLFLCRFIYNAAEISIHSTLSLNMFLFFWLSCLRTVLLFTVFSFVYLLHGTGCGKASVHHSSICFFPLVFVFLFVELSSTKHPSDDDTKLPIIYFYFLWYLLFTHEIIPGTIPLLS